MKTSIKTISLILLVFITSAFTINDSGYGIGDYATDFELKNIDGKKVSLKDYKEAKGFLVIFTCNSCPYAVAYEDRIIALDKKYKSLGVPVIAINPNNPELQPRDGFDQMKKRAADKGFTFPYLLDEEQDIFPQYGATRTPHVFLLENTSKGYLVRYIGAIDDNYQDASQVETKYVEDAVEAMLAGEEIKITTTKAIGCAIKV
ncbi:AhpC/TSA family protein [Zhouia amylolytica]|uniref:AhpC/TSA family protein n=1 Tax=Zhouia amylolytica TaxID=376730 RepID=A0A1I6TR83_9FLAO|nr:thioredoxin family protein [Zhouia amylolytica]SFS91691.1 AhpC/TSA family protein [Zhouia amylolytica]